MFGQDRAPGADTARMEHEDHHRVTKVVLPSGKTIKVVSFSEEDDYAPLPADETTLGAETDLHICRSCGSHLAYPTSWSEAGEETWAVEIRCPECDTWREGTFSQAAVEEFDAALDAGADALIADYRRLLRTNMAEEVDRFARALAVGAILPEDF